MWRGCASALRVAAQKSFFTTSIATCRGLCIPRYHYCAHILRFTPTGNVAGINTFGACDAPVMLGRELALSAIWALYAVEVCRFGQPRMAQVVAIGTEAGLPVDLRSSDQQPDKQPKDQSAYWHQPPGASRPDGEVRS